MVPIGQRMSNKFQFYEVVKVVSVNPKLSEIAGKFGAILGMAQNDDGTWGYSVHVFNEEDGWDVMESDLEATGKIMRREDFYDGSSIRIRVDPETGEGSIVDDE